MPEAGGFNVSHQSAGDPPLRIDPDSISYAYVALTLEDRGYADAATDEIAGWLRRIHPRLWSVPFRVKYVSFAVNADDEGYPDPGLVHRALESVGLARPYSLIINSMSYSPDGGRTELQALVGFAYRDGDAKIVIARDGGCVPRQPSEHGSAPAPASPSSQRSRGRAWKYTRWGEAIDTLFAILVGLLFVLLFAAPFVFFGKIAWDVTHSVLAVVATVVVVGFGYWVLGRVLDVLD